MARIGEYLIADSTHCQVVNAHTAEEAAEMAAEEYGWKQVTVIRNPKADYMEQVPAVRFVKATTDGNKPN